MTTTMRRNAWVITGVVLLALLTALLADGEAGGGNGGVGLATGEACVEAGDDRVTVPMIFDVAAIHVALATAGDNLGRKVSVERVRVRPGRDTLVIHLTRTARRDGCIYWYVIPEFANDGIID